MPQQKIAPASITALISAFSQQIRLGVPYGYGAKAEGGADPRTGHRWNTRSTHKLSTPLSTIDHIDCSGEVRKLLYDASGGKLEIVDGSQSQLAQFEAWANAGLVKEVRYRDAAAYMNKKRLFICFIKPGENGCGPIGHVFLLVSYDPDAAADTMESYGGHGVGSRNWNTTVLLHETYKCFEIPTVD